MPHRPLRAVRDNLIAKFIKIKYTVGKGVPASRSGARFPPLPPLAEENGEMRCSSLTREIASSVLQTLRTLSIQWVIYTLI